MFRGDQIMDFEALGEVVLWVQDLQRVTEFYTTMIGLEVLREFEGITFLRIANGYGGTEL